jgi:hypothetical protein
MKEVTLFLGGDVMTGRGIDPILDESARPGRREHPGRRADGPLTPLFGRTASPAAGESACDTPRRK